MLPALLVFLVPGESLGIHDGPIGADVLDDGMRRVIHHHAVDVAVDLADPLRRTGKWPK